MRNHWDTYLAVRDRTLAGQHYRTIARDMGMGPFVVRAIQKEIARPLPVMTVDEFNRAILNGARPMPTRNDIAA